MKKTVILAALGLSIGALSSFGQGAIVFNSYNADGVGSGLTKITFLNGGALVGAGYSADVYYSLSPISQPSGNDSLSAGWLASGSGSPSVNSLITPMVGGYFTASVNFQLNPYTAGTPVYFEVAVYQTAAGSYANSTADRGHSASFSATLATGLVQPSAALFNSFTVAPVPEPTTLALAGLGGLASLVALRRKKA